MSPSPQQSLCDPAQSAKAETEWVEAILASWALEDKSDGAQISASGVANSIPKSREIQFCGEMVGVIPFHAVLESDAPGEFADWEREAEIQRLTTLLAKGKSAKAIRDGYVPVFTPLRHPDKALEFERGGSPEKKGRRLTLVRHQSVSKALTFIGGAILLIVLGSWTGGLLRMARDSQSKSEAAARLQTTLSPEPARSTAGMIPEMKKLVASFFAAQTPEEKSAFVRGGKSLLPVMREYYSKHPREPSMVKVDSNVGFVNEAGLEFVHVTGRSAAGDPFDAVVQKTPSGPRLDWRHLTGSGEIEWSDWARIRPSKPVTLCVIAKLDDYYSGPFSGPQEWVCLKMTDINKSSTVWAYARRTNAIGLLLTRELRDRKRVFKFKGSFAFPDPASTGSSLNDLTPQVAIHSVVSLDWLDRSPEVTPEGHLFSSLSP